MPGLCVSEKGGGGRREEGESYGEREGGLQFAAGLCWPLRGRKQVLVSPLPVFGRNE